MSQPADRVRSSARGDDIDALQALVLSALIDIDHYESQLPHLVMCIDPTLGDASFSGPFATYALAKQVADHELRTAGPASRMTFQVAPLYPPLVLADAIERPVSASAVGALATSAVPGGQPVPQR